MDKQKVLEQMYQYKERYEEQRAYFTGKVDLCYDIIKFIEKEFEIEKDD